MNARRISQIGVAALTAAAWLNLGTAAHAQEEAVVHYRLVGWKSAHFDDARSARSFEEAIKRIGCETRQEQHNGHIDVTYRCPQWRSISASNDDAAHRWQNWLRQNGFETRHEH